jgi:mono/diheme cytochrome c family protein
MMQAIKPLFFCALMAFGVSFAATASAQGTTFSQIERGRYLSKVGDCASCHTAKGGKPLAGGFPIATPFGIIYSTNITPDEETGIGKWSSDDFFKAMHSGIRRDGQHLYPAFPYPWFTKLSRSDVDAIKSYLDTIEPVKQQNKSNELPWPLSWREMVAGWNLLFFDEGTYQPDPSKSATWNRGAYLVEGGGHCAACHTPKNVLGAAKGDDHLQGGDAGESWFAPSLSSDLRDGIGNWSVAQIVEYLKTGSNHQSATAGPMTDVIINSTQYLSDEDLHAIAVYLKTLPQSGADTAANKTQLDKQAMAQGHDLYWDNCIGCHMEDGAGLKKVFPPLKGSAAIQAKSAASLIQVVLAGEQMAATPNKPTGFAMPAFGWKLSDQQVADLVNYIRNAWGNSAPLVDSGDVADVRADIKKYGTAQQNPLHAAR